VVAAKLLDMADTPEHLKADCILRGNEIDRAVESAVRQWMQIDK